jgi:hypothetical protein
MRMRIATFLVLANYVLALTVGGSLHLHGDHRCTADSPECVSACSHEAAEPHGGCGSHRAGCCEPAGTATEGAGAVSSASEKCPVCRFLAKKPAPARAVEAVACTQLVENRALVHPLRRADHTPSSHLIRGPPAAA